MPRQPSSQELLTQAQVALSMPGASEPESARRLRRLAQVNARLARYVPSERNRKIFEEVVIRHKPQEEVAFYQHLSRQRVARIVQRMKDWIAFWGGDDAAYGPQQRYRLATHVATSELAEFQRLIREALTIADRVIEGKKFRYDHNGAQVGTVFNYQSYPRPTNLYKMLLTAILTRARLTGAGRDAELEPTAGGPSQSMVVRTEINVNQATGSPPKGAVRSDDLSGSTCAGDPADVVFPTAAAERS